MNKFKYGDKVIDIGPLSPREIEDEEFTFDNLRWLTVINYKGNGYWLCNIMGWNESFREDSLELVNKHSLETEKKALKKHGRWYNPYCPYCNKKDCNKSLRAHVRYSY